MTEAEKVQSDSLFTTNNTNTTQLSNSLVKDIEIQTTNKIRNEKNNISEEMTDMLIESLPCT